VGEDAGLECKTASALTKTKYDKGDIPIQYYLQCVHYMAVTGKKKWYIAVLVMGKGFYHFEVNRDENEIELLIDGEEVFWNYVKEDKMPPVDDTESTKEALLKMYPQAESNFKKDLFDKDDMLDRYNELKSLEKKIKKEITEIENNLKKDLGECDTGSTDKYRVNWKNTSSMRVNQEELKKKYPNIYNECLKESKTRRFTVKENTEE
jgi:predicted phage-related endonuclease